jgi:hypothetical protein
MSTYDVVTSPLRSLSSGVNKYNDARIELISNVLGGMLDEGALFRVIAAFTEDRDMRPPVIRLENPCDQVFNLSEQGIDVFWRIVARELDGMVNERHLNRFISAFILDEGMLSSLFHSTIAVINEEVEETYWRQLVRVNISFDTIPYGTICFSLDRGYENRLINFVVPYTYSVYPYCDNCRRYSLTQCRFCYASAPECILGRKRGKVGRFVFIERFDGPDETLSFPTAFPPVYMFPPIPPAIPSFTLSPVIPPEVHAFGLSLVEDTDNCPMMD